MKTTVKKCPMTVELIVFDYTIVPVIEVQAA